MPCLVLTGHPCAGKTTLAELIKEECLKPGHNLGISNIVIINESTACPGQTLQECYATSRTEKATRGALKSALDRAMGDASDKTSGGSSTLVILDSLNYIKGFRYELHCLSKAAQQQHGIVWALNSVSTAKEWNQKRREQGKDAYSDELFDELVLRYEPPDERNRWDRPLFCIHVLGDDTSTSRQALEKSVYNMHNLSSVLNDSYTAQGGANIPSASVPQPKKQTKVKFKRKLKKQPTATVQDTASSNEVETPATANESPGGESNVDSTIPTAEQPPTSQPPIRRPTVEEQLIAMLTQFLKSTQPLQQGLSTQVHTAHANADFMHLLDKVTQQICRSITTTAAAEPMRTSKTTDISVNFTHSAVPTTTNTVVDSRLLSYSNDQLQTARRQYLAWCEKHPPSASDASTLAMEFCDYLQAQVLSKE